jgi:hypothetical protein
MSKKSRKRNKKILAALALAGGAAMLAKGRGKGTGAVSTAGQAFGVDRITPKAPFISKKADVVSDAAPKSYLSRMSGVAPDGGYVGQDHRARKIVTDVTHPVLGQSTARPDRFGRLKGGGIAKRGKGAAYKSGGRVKSMGAAKRGGGVAKR